MLGLLFVVRRYLGKPWWRFTLYGLAVSILPGAITYEPFHALRLLALPIFLLLLTVPALEWLLGVETGKGRSVESFGVPKGVRFAILGFVLALTIFEATR